MSRKIRILAVVLLLALCLTACGAPAQEAFTVRVVCESQDVYQIFYTCYLNGERWSMGGMADYDGAVLTAESDLALVFSKSGFEGAEDVSGFAIDFSPYGKDDTAEIATTETISIAAEYGESYTVRFYGDRASGFRAELLE